MFLFNISTYILPSTFILWEVNKVLNIIVIISWNRFQNLFIINHSLLENDIDGDAFCLLKDESLKVMIKSQGLLLKFQKIYSQLVSDKESHSCAPEVAEVETDVVVPQVTKKTVLNL